jgi:uncharacterized membrane protein
MVVGAIGLSIITINIDQSTGAAAEIQIRYLWRGGPDGARGLLEVIAGSMMTVASLTFSLTIVTFSQASSQFGPRLLRNFMRDTGNQVVLGTFIATFVYCLLILRAVRSGREASEGVSGVEEFVPYLSVSMGFVLALISLGVLIYFFHHVSQSIYAPNVIAAVADDLMGAIERIFPNEEEPLKVLDRAGDEINFPDGFDEHSIQLSAAQSGYLQWIDYNDLFATASEHDLHLVITHRPGHFVIKGDDLAKVGPPERAKEPVMSQLRTAFSIGRQRSAPQDVEYAIDQLVEVAVRALSAGINDPFTAINCIDWLGVALSRLAEKKIPPPYFCDPAGKCRIVLMHPVTFQGLTDAAFNQIRQHAGSHVSVLIRMLEVIAVIAEHTSDEKEIQALERQAKMILRSSHKILREVEDLKDIDERFRQVEEAEAD